MAKNHWKNLLKLVFIGALLFLLARRGFISIADTQRALVQWKYTAPAFGIFFVCIGLCICRWHLLIRAQRIATPFKRTLQLGMIGSFFNIALPGPVTGDFIKAYYIGKESEGKEARAVGSILFDRVAGLAGLILLSSVSFVLGFEADPAVKAFVLSAAASVISFFAYLFLVKDHHDPLLILLKRLEARHPRFGSVKRVYEGVRDYRENRGIVIAVILISVVSHILIAVASWNLAQALGESQITLQQLFVIIPLGLLVTAIPLAPAGVGTGHAAFAYLFPLIGSSQGANVFNFHVLQSILAGCIGGLVYLRFKVAVRQTK